MKPKIELLREAEGYLREKIRAKEYTVELEEKVEQVTITSTKGYINGYILEKALMAINYYSFNWFVSEKPLQVIIY